MNPNKNYIVSQLSIVAPFPLHQEDVIRVKFLSERGVTNWINLTPDQFNRIEALLEE